MNSETTSRRICRALTAFILILFFLISVNCLLPAKIQFPAWKNSLNLEKVQTETDAGTRTDYVNSRGNIVVALDKNYSTVLQTLDEYGNCVLEQYLDQYGNPVMLAQKYSAIRREYNDLGQNTYTEYLDRNLNPVTILSGYSSTRRKYNSDGLLEEIQFFDIAGNPAMSRLKRYGARYVYNDDGLASEVLSIDAEGNLMTTVYRYAISKRTYNPDRSLRTEMFYDKDGEPVRMLSGQYGYLYENGNTICLDRDGNKMFVPSHFLIHSFISTLTGGILLVILIAFACPKLNRHLLVLYLAFIIFMTFMLRVTGRGLLDFTLPPNLFLLLTDREIMNNVWLFIPLGEILYQVFRSRKVVIIPVLLSLLIETLQYVLDIGRFELSDFVANSIGGIFGAMLCYLLLPWVQRVKAACRRK